MLLHTNLECQLGLLKCRDCGHHVKFSKYTTHLTSTENVSCSNGCANPVTMDTLEDHMRKCPQRKMMCKFASCGCTADVTARMNKLQANNQN